jgi:hypothetical protein
MPLKTGIWTTAALCAALVAGCGGGDKTSSDTGSSSTPTTTTAVPNPAEAEIRTVAIAYVHALAAKDFAAACATRASKDIQALEKSQFGTCEAAYKAITVGKPVEVYADAKPGDVRIKGDIAGVDIVVPSNTSANLRLGAVKENGKWLLRDVPNAQIP